MAHTKISVTVPDEILYEVRRMAADREIKISRLIAEALADKVKVDKSRLLEKIGSLESETVDEILDGCRMAISKKVF